MKMKSLMHYAGLAALILTASFGCGRQQHISTVGTNPEVERRVAKILSSMTLEEKIGQMNQVSAGGDVSS